MLDENFVTFMVYKGKEEPTGKYTGRENIQLGGKACVRLREYLIPLPPATMYQRNQRWFIKCADERQINQAGVLAKDNTVQPIDVEVRFKGVQESIGDGFYNIKLYEQC